MPVPRRKTQEDTRQIENVFAHMTQTDMNNLAAVLKQGKDALVMSPFYLRTPLQGLAFSSARGKQLFGEFLAEHTITYLGGGNSKNFRIEPRDGKPPYVLKLEAWSADDEVLAHIESVESISKADLAPVYFDRAVSCNGDQLKIQVVPLYVGDIETLSKKNMSDQQRIDDALFIYQQMASVYETFRKANIVFPDGKNANWLMDRHGELYMADIKSLQMTNARGDAQNLAQYRDYFMSIPEPGPDYHADSIHALHLAKNLYQYLTGCSWSYLSNPQSPNRYVAANSIRGCDVRNYDFSASIFQTPAGSKLKVLIEGMIQIDPNARLSVSHFLEELWKIEQELVQNDGFWADMSVSVELPKSDGTVSLESLAQAANLEQLAKPHKVEALGEAEKVTAPVKPEKPPKPQKVERLVEEAKVSLPDKPEKPLKSVIVLTSNLKESYVKNFTDFKSRLDDLDPAPKAYRGDPVKQEILARFKTALAAIDSPEALEEYVTEFEQSDDYNVLNTQDATRQKYGLKNVAIIEWNRIVQEARDSLAELRFSNRE